MKNKFIKSLIKYIFCFTLIISGFFMLSETSVSAGEMTMHTISIGRGDAILISSNNHYMLIDSGTAQSGSVIINYLNKLNIPENKIDYIISTHPDGDHVGSFAEIFKHYDVGQVFYSPCPKASNVYVDFITAVKEKGCPFRTPKENEKWPLGDAVVQVVYDGSQGSTYNECSIVLKVTCDGKSILLTGDLPSTMENELIHQGYNFKSDVLKIGHHGASASSCANFLDAVKPDYAVISCDNKDKTIFPKASVLQRLARRFIKTYRTSDGDVVINFKDGKITTSNKENNGFISIRKGTITLSNNVFYANGKSIKPSVVLYVNGIYVPPAHYKVTYTSNKYTGIAKIKLTATEVKYVSVCRTTFLILPQRETLKASLENYNKAKLSWSSQSHATGYTLMYSTDKKFATGLKYITNKNPKLLSKIISDLDYNTKYYFKVRAYKSNIGYGKWSKTASVKTGTPPLPAKEKITKSTASKNKIKLSWKKLSPRHKAGYRLQYSTNKKFIRNKKLKTIKYKTTEKNYLTLRGLKRNTTYYIRIRGFNKYGNGKWSKTLKIRTAK